MLKRIRLYFKNIAISLDQTLNAVLGGSPDECLSTRAYDPYPKLAKFINWITRNPNHCKHSAENEYDDPAIN